MDERPDAAPGQERTFILQEKLLSIGGDLWIEDAAGNHAFEVDGQAFAIRRTLYLLDLDRRPIYEINASLMHIHRTFEIKRGEQIVATVQQALMALFGDRFKVVFADGSELAIRGDIWDHEFSASRQGEEVFAASRRWFSLHGAYAIRVAPDFDVPLALAIAIALEQMELEERRKRQSGFGFGG